MKFFVTSILILLSNAALLAQLPIRDSLLNKLQEYEQRDTVRVEMILELFKYELSNNLDSALLLANEMLDIGQEIRDKKTEGLARVYRGMYFGRNTLYDKALKEQLLAVKILEKVGSLDEQLLAKSELNSSYRATGEPEKALAISLEILEIAKQQKESPTTARYYFEVGNAYGTLERYDEAEEYFKETIAIAKKFNYTPGEMIGKQRLMEVYLNTKKYKELEKIGEELNDYYKSTENKDKLAKNQYLIASAKIKQGEHEAAIPLLEQALKGFQETKRNLFIEKTAQKLYICYSVLDDQEKAEAANQIYLVAYDSIQSQKQKKIVESVKAEYETDKLKQEKLLETERAKKNRNQFIASVIIGLFLLSLTFLYIYQQKLKKRAELAEIKLAEIQSKLSLERKLNNAEIKALKAQMNPHFLFNAFNSIQEFIIMNNRELASDYLGKFADLMRLYLDHSREKTISIQDEMTATELYLDLEKMRFEDKLNYSIQLSDEVRGANAYLPPMLIQPFIENSLKHGLLHKKDNRQLNIDFEMDGDTLVCTVADNGIGRKQSTLLNAKKLKKHKSFATSATQNRIELLNVGRDKDITMEIIDLEDENKKALGTKVVIRIPNENL